ncbi:MAG TPA: ATP-dependent DNA helicase [Verrucomicrobiales bacterium]|nr:ATP-dependent DNA helicase [Verrucomicrobiales bacterium]
MSGSTGRDDAVSEVARRIVRVSVRALVEFSNRSGSLRGVSLYRSARRARLGADWHRRIQASRPADYQAEVSLLRVVPGALVDLQIEGRLDGVFPSRRPPLIEEIKTVQRGETAPGTPVHWAQAQVYGALWCAQTGEPEVDIQLTYVEWESGQLSVLRRAFSAEDLEAFLQQTLSVYLQWVEGWERRRRLRNESLEALYFPFAAPRPGQDALMEAVGRTLAQGGRLVAEAPTGIGKSMGALFPALQALGRDEADRIVYLTARTAGRAPVRAAFQDLAGAGARLSVLFLTARDRICFRQDGCEEERCPFCEGYFDRIRPARAEAADLELLDEESLAAVARRHRVCPFALSLELAPWVDAVVGDYNYVFSPRIRLQCFAGAETRRSLLLVDEAHHLADRARELYSAEVDQRAFERLRSELGRSLSNCRKALDQVLVAFREIRVEAQEGILERCPPGLEGALERFRRAADDWLARGEDAPFRDALLENYFAAAQFLQPGEVEAPESFRLLWRARDRAGLGSLRRYCLDPAPHLAAALAQWKAAVFFSATLRPAQYWAKVWGLVEDWESLAVGSPFPPEHLEVIVHRGIPTQYRARARSLAALTRALERFTQARPGSSLIFFPSYAYLRAAAAQFTTTPGTMLLCQEPGMSLPEQRRFLEAFDGKSRVTGFAVMGGLFGEGIDLAGARLTAVAVVGIGLPGIGLERDLQRVYYGAAEEGEWERPGGDQGYLFAYVYPGITRVLQAVGRLIRSESDRGAALLVDPRYGDPAVRALLPVWWRIRETLTEKDLAEVWREEGKAKSQSWGGGDSGETGSPSQ